MKKDTEVVLSAHSSNGEDERLEMASGDESEEQSGFEESKESDNSSQSD